MPHGYCLLWRPGLLWLHIASDLIIGLSYYCIPFVLLFFIRKRKDLPFRAVFLLFGAFIFLCGTTHLFSIWVLWFPNYYIEGWVKAATAAVSFTTLITTLFYVPRALGLASPAELAKENVALTERYKKVEEQGRVMLTAVVDHMADGLINIKAPGLINGVNPAFTTIFGYQPQDVVGQPLWMLLAEEHQAPAMAHGAGENASAPAREFTGRRQDGTLFPMSVAISGFTLEGQQYFCWIVRDITIEKLADENRERLLARLTESNTELERFAYVASHDMQEPVRMMQNFSQILLRSYGTVLDERGREYLEIISTGALRMRALITDLLNYARLNSGADPRSEVCIADQLKEMRENLRQLIEDTHAVITAEEPLPCVRGRPVQIMRLFQNLVANGIKFQPAGQVPLVHIGVAARQDGWLFSVKDNGLGIEQKYLEEIFQPFRRLHGWDTFNGTGLGLSVCRKIVEGHGGKIWAESTPGSGTTIHFTLPAAA